METANICCFGSGPSASETLKNLVLPNVQKFTIVDDAVVTEADTGNNFFVDHDSIGQPRCQVVASLLQEMNSECKGACGVVRSVKDVITNEIDFVDKFSLVIASCVPKEPLLLLAEHCRDKGISLLINQSYGLIGYVRLQIPEHCIVESHFDNDRADLFLHPDQLKTFPELAEFIKSFDLSDKASFYDHSHTPYAVILGQHMAKWQAEHDGKAPQSYSEKSAFRKQIEAAERKEAGGEENFAEAIKFAFKAYDRSGTCDLLCWEAG